LSLSIAERDKAEGGEEERRGRERKIERRKILSLYEGPRCPL
jgi:hypothetical protein